MKEIGTVNDPQALTELSGRVFSQVKTILILNMRFLDMAVFRLQPTPADVSLATDGARLYYRPARLLRRYRDESAAVVRDYLHVLLHCIFRHPFVHTLVDHDLWDLACDMAAEAMICDFNLSQAATADEAKKKAVLEQLRARVKPFTAEKLYRHFRTHKPNASWAKLFHADEHDIWYDRQERDHAASGGSGGGKPRPDPGRSLGDAGNETGGSQPDGGAEEQNEPNTPGNRPAGDRNAEDPNEPNMPMDHSGGDGNAANQSITANQPIPRDQLEREWRDISEHVQMDLEAFTRQQGTEAGHLLRMLGELNRERYNYETFLKKFATLGEVMKINDDEFDYIFYTYGLKLFGSMPLIEPLEYKEVKRVREFVIAIDTSGSTSGELVAKFLNKTYNILMSTESFFSKVNIHIIQCDAQIQEAVKVTDRKDFEACLKRLTVKGLGGTDFRPVFGYVDRLIRQHEFRRLQGLIYFTDGYGTFPEQKPEYRTAFVFVQDEYMNVKVPGWAMKVVLEKDEV